MKADDLYTKVTNDILARFNTSGEWIKPWFDLGASNPTSQSSGKPYRGINWVILTMEHADRGYTSNRWGTYKQWFGMGDITTDPETLRDVSTVNVRKGETGTPIFLWKKERPSKRMLARDPNAKEYLLARVFYVFNRDQVEGLPAIVPTNVTEHERWDAADEYFRAIGANVTEDGDRAYYAPVADRIAVPTMAQFPYRDHFYSTMAHEHVHWTGHESRLNRDLHNRFGSEAYAAEELVAELGAAFWGAQMGMSPAVRTDHASYVANWVKILTNDRKAIVTAASKAQAAVDFLNQAAGFSLGQTTDQAIAA